MIEKVQIDEEFVTLGQFLKHINIITTGGQAKWFLQEYNVFVDGKLENRRGKKLFHGSKIEILDHGIYLIEQTDSENKLS